METAQDILNSLHNQFGLTDVELGEALSVSREHISRLRHGKKNASNGLYDGICDLFTEISEAHTVNQKPQIKYTQDDEVATSGLPWGLIAFIGITIVGIIIVVVMATRDAHKDQESDQSTSPEQKTLPNQWQGSQFPYMPPYQAPE